MSFIFTADWHIKTKFREVPFSWLSDRFLEWLIFLENCRKELNTDTLVIGGDLFDKVPSMFDLALFATLEYVTNFDEIIIYPGNHELLSKKNNFYSYLEKIFPRYTWISKSTQWRDWYIVPYPDIKTIKSLEGHDLVLSHVRCESDRGLYAAEIDFNIFNNCRTVLLGDIHLQRTINNKIFYPGSPYDTAFTYLPLQPNYYIYVDNCISIRPIPKTQKRLIKVTTTLEKYQSVKEKVKNSKHYYDIEILVESLEDLEAVKGHDMVKAKLKEINIDYTDADTLEEEMYYYLVGVLNMGNEHATQIMTTYKDLSSAN